MHCKRDEAGVIIAGLLTSACPKARHTRPLCAARNSGTIAQSAAPTITTRHFVMTLEKACRDDTHASYGGLHEATALQRKQVLGPVGRRVGGRGEGGGGKRMMQRLAGRS